MKILIVGAQGMLGSALQDIFRDQAPIALNQAQLDITDSTAVAEKIKEISPQLIINAAAYTDVDGAESDRATAFAVNATGVRNLALAAKNCDATIVHYSTDYVFPGTDAAGYKEVHPPGPTANVYGESKLAGEQVLAQSGARYYLLRTAWLYGPHGKNFVDTMLQLSQTKPTLAVVNDQYGSPTFTYDVARATAEIIAHYEPGVYHTVNQGSTTWYAFAQRIFKQVGRDIAVTPVSSAEFPRPAKRPQYSMLRNTQGPVLRHWEAALDDYLKNYQSNQAK